jgi:hypothetical protein
MLANLKAHLYQVSARSRTFGLRSADRVLDGCGLIPPKGGHHYGPRQSA